MNKKMNAWVLHEIGEFQYEEVEIPVPREKEVLVRVKAAGICGSDIPRVYKTGAHVKPLILGHEFSGEVCRVGENVDKTWIGKKVGIFPLIPCMECAPCQKKQYEMCQNYSYLGSRTDGGFGEYAVVPKWNLIELPDEVSFEEAAMMEPMAVAVHAMRGLFEGQKDLKDKIIVVWGLGTIGILLTMFLKQAGANRILAIGNKEFQKQKLLELGIEENDYCDCIKEDAPAWILQKTHNLGADYLFECVGKKETMQSVISLGAPGAGVMLVGNPYADMELDRQTYWKILRHQLTIKGTWNSSYTGDVSDDWHFVCDCLKEGRIHPAQLISHRYRMKDIEAGFHIMRDKTQDYVKIMGLYEGDERG